MGKTTVVWCGRPPLPGDPGSLFFNPASERDCLAHICSNHPTFRFLVPDGTGLKAPLFYENNMTSHYQRQRLHTQSTHSYADWNDSKPHFTVVFLPCSAFSARPCLSWPGHVWRGLPVQRVREAELGNDLQLIFSLSGKTRGLLKLYWIIRISYVTNEGGQM